MKSNKLLISIIIFLILLVIGGAAGIIWYLTQDATPQTAQQVSKKVDPAHETLAQIGPLYPLEPFTVNLKNPEGKDIYLNITLSLELDDKLLANELDAKNAVIRDHIILILSSKTMAEIESDLGKRKMCQEIKTDLNTLLSDGQIRNVYIVNFIVQ